MPRAWRQPDFSADVQPTLRLRLARDDLRLGFLVTVTTFSTPQQVTLDELRIESCFPLDDETREACMRIGASFQTPGSPASLIDSTVRGMCPLNHGPSAPYKHTVHLPVSAAFRMGARALRPLVLCAALNCHPASRAGGGPAAISADNSPQRTSGSELLHGRHRHILARLPKAPTVCGATYFAPDSPFACEEAAGGTWALVATAQQPLRDLADEAAEEAGGFCQAAPVLRLALVFRYISGTEWSGPASNGKTTHTAVWRRGSEPSSTSMATAFPKSLWSKPSIAKAFTTTSTRSKQFAMAPLSITGRRAA